MSDSHDPPSPASPGPGPTGTPPAAELPAATMDDAGSQALSAALHSSFRIIRVLMAGLVLLFLCSGVFTVGPNEVAVVLRFGRPVGLGADQLRKPGWHWAYPYPIDEKVPIKVGQSHTVTSSTGWYAVTPEMEARGEEPTPYGFLRPEADGYVLTADGNIVHARATLKYRITDPLQWTFGFTNAPAILTNIVNNALFFAAAHVRAEDALYKNKSDFRDRVLARVQTKIEEINLGIALEPSDVETRAPVDVRKAFEDVNAAEQARSTVVSDARGYRDIQTRTAQGQAQAIISAGLVSSNALVSQVSAFAQAFDEQLPSYRANSRLFKERLLAAAMERILTNASIKFTLPEQFDELRLQLSREPERIERPQ